MVSFTHEQNIISSQTQLDDIAHKQTIICRQLLVSHVVGFRSMKRKKNLHRMLISFTYSSFSLPLFHRNLSSREESLLPAKPLKDGIGLLIFLNG